MFIVAFSNSPILNISHHYSGTANISVRDNEGTTKYLQNKY